MSTKVCKDCGLEGDESLFRPQSNQCRECRKEYLRAYEESNRAKRTAQKLAWAEQHPEKAKKISRKTKFRHRERIYAENNAKKAEMFGAEGSHTVDEWLAVCSLTRWRCIACKEVKPLMRDHIIPLSRGGTDYIYNIQPLCRSCNTAKGNEIIDYRFAL